MSDEFDPGAGWRRTFRQEAIHHGDYLHLNFANEGVAAVYWVREKPVPALDPLWTVYDRYVMPNDVQKERGLNFVTFRREVEEALQTVLPVSGPEEPVPALPTTEGTTVRVTASSESDIVGALLHLDLSDAAYPWNGNADAYPAALIDAFEVLAEPRAVIAKAVLDRVRELQLTTAIGHVDIVDVVRTEFGAKS